MNETLANFNGQDGVTIFVVVLLEQAGFPIPAAPWLLAAGARCAANEASSGTVIGVTVFACLIADLAWFYIGKKGGRQVLNFLYRSVFPKQGFAESVERSFTRHSMALLVISKFVPGLSIVVPPLAGALSMKLPRFLIFDWLSAVAYAVVYLVLGVVLNEQVRTVLEVLKDLGLGSLLLLAAWIAAHFTYKHFFGRRVHQRQGQQTRNAPARQPISAC